MIGSTVFVGTVFVGAVFPGAVFLAVRCRRALVQVVLGGDGAELLVHATHPSDRGATVDGAPSPAPGRRWCRPSDAISQYPEVDPGRTPTMTMRQNCKYFESRSYPNGDTVRKCDLDLAPEAPWRCPDDCSSYTPRMADVNWAHGSLVTPPTPVAPKSVGEDPSIGALLDEAEDIVNEAGPRIRSEVDADRSRKAKGPRWKFWKRR